MDTDGDDRQVWVVAGLLGGLCVLVFGAILLAPSHDAPRPQPTRPTTEYTLTPARPASAAPLVLLGDPCEPGQTGVTGTGVTAVCVESGTRRGEATWKLGGWLVTPTRTP